MLRISVEYRILINIVENGVSRPWRTAWDLRDGKIEGGTSIHAFLLDCSGLEPLCGEVLELAEQA